jgi:hypothetical protein
MKSRLSLTVDPKVTYRAKRYARAKNKSLSALVEELLEQVASADGIETVEQKTSFSNRWSGELSASKKEEPRYRGLAEKYDLK